MNASTLQLILDSETKPKTLEDVQRLTRRLIGETGTLLPLPGAGQTRSRWEVFAALGAFDLSVAKLFESHFDALAILQEAGVPAHTGIYGVWASKFGGKYLRGEQDSRSGNWLIQGEIAFASGVSTIDHSLVPVSTPKGEILFQIPKEAIVSNEIDRSRWHTPGMQDAETAWIRVEAQLPESQTVGDAGFYLNRPGFWAGGLGVAACWLGAAQKIFETWHLGALAKSYSDPLDQAARAHAFCALKACSTQLMALANQLDGVGLSSGNGMREALMLRHLSDRVANEVAERSARSLGPILMVGNAEHSRRVLDLQVFTRQCHGEKDLVVLAQDLERNWTDKTFEKREVWFE